MESQAIEGKYLGVTAKVYRGRCMHPGCSSTAVFPAYPEDFKDTRHPPMEPCSGHGPQDSESQEEEETTMRQTVLPHKNKKTYYSENKNAILADIQSIGRKATMKKWGIPVSTMHYLLRRWNVQAPPSRRHQQRQAQPDTPTPPKPPQNGHQDQADLFSVIHLLPQFDPSWTFSKRRAWIEATTAVIKAAITVPGEGRIS